MCSAVSGHGLLVGKMRSIRHHNPLTFAMPLSSTALPLHLFEAKAVHFYVDLLYCTH